VHARTARTHAQTNGQVENIEPPSPDRMGGGGIGLIIQSTQALNLFSKHGTYEYDGKFTQVCAHVVLLYFFLLLSGYICDEKKLVRIANRTAAAISAKILRRDISKVPELVRTVVMSIS